MKDGDLVRFKIASKFSLAGKMEAWKIGLLVEYHTWEKIATILYGRKIYRIHASQVQKAGKKDNY